MNKQEIIELAKQVGIPVGLNGYDKEIQTIAALIEQSVIKRLSAGAGEHIARANVRLNNLMLSANIARPHLPDGMHNLYTAEQVAAAVAAETERCAKVCDQIECRDIEGACEEYKDGKEMAALQIAAAIRGRTV